ncbi:MAG: hypothetical protein V2I62_05790 [Bacteroidales bacterium]|jgi:hypothetical protein|nr:hypothetical protein [Bacteroidales bacterium]
MRFVTFRTPKPKQFKYKPRYYDENIDALEKRKAELGFDSSVSHHESLKLQMSKRWRKSDRNYKKSTLSKMITYLFIGFVIVGGIYLIFFTEFVEKLIALFGIR